MAQQGLCCHCLSHVPPALPRAPHWPREQEALWECVPDPGTGLGPTQDPSFKSSFAHREVLVFRSPRRQATGCVVQNCIRCLLHAEGSFSSGHIHTGGGNMDRPQVWVVEAVCIGASLSPSATLGKARSAEPRGPGQCGAVAEHVALTQ